MSFQDSSGDDIKFTNVGNIILRQAGESGEFPTRNIRLVNNEEIVIKKFDQKASHGEKTDERNLVFDIDSRFMISRRHAKVSFKNGAFFVEDLKSSNGTFHNDRKLEQNKLYQLKSGDNIRLGKSFILMIEEINGSTTNESSPMSRFTEKKLNLICSAVNSDNKTKDSQDIESNVLSDKEESPMQIPSVSSTKGMHFQQLIFSDKVCHNQILFSLFYHSIN